LTCEITSRSGESVTGSLALPRCPQLGKCSVFACHHMVQPRYAVAQPLRRVAESLWMRRLDH
jgi:hypothetical protein